MKNSNTFICLLSEEHQTEIRIKLTKYFWNQGYSLIEVTEFVENAMDNRLWMIEDVVNIKKYLV